VFKKSGLEFYDLDHADHMYFDVGLMGIIFCYVLVLKFTSVQRGTSARGHVTTCFN